MIIIPEIETVVLLNPRTGSGSLYRAIEARYPRSMLLYRHMEADGVPTGYTRWRRVGVVRHPINRLWSLYNYIKVINHQGKTRTDVISRLLKSVEVDFETYLLCNEITFTHPYGRFDGKYHPVYSQLHCMPENYKSQFIYLRPDLGTEIFTYEADLPQLFSELDVSPGTENETNAGPRPRLSVEALNQSNQVFNWERMRGYILEEGEFG